jgi:hypothetical protein
MRVSGEVHAPAVLYPGENTPGTHLVGGWVDLRASMDTVATLCRVSNPFRLCVQSIVRHYPDVLISMLSFVISRCVLRERGCCARQPTFGSGSRMFACVSETFPATFDFLSSVHSMLLRPLRTSFEPSRVGGGGLYVGSLKDLYGLQEHWKTRAASSSIHKIPWKHRRMENFKWSTCVFTCIKPILIAYLQGKYNIQSVELSVFWDLLTVY